ncbi:2-dehydro-3-deoxygalactonokinase [Rhodobacteraceae bacterium]|nr:2-dehydro-3-deoxygalactonokinase [Paracoccaceae bacterium]
MENWLAGSADNAQLRLWHNGTHASEDIALQGAAPDDLMRTRMDRLGISRAVLAGPDGARRPLPCTAMDPQPAAQGLHLLPGLSQASTGEYATATEATTIAGVLKAQPRFDGAICLTGDTTLWAHISAQEVVSITRTGTGKLFHALYGAILPEIDAEFDHALSETLSRPERLMRLTATATSGAGLGALIGAELAAARPWWLGLQVLAFGPLARFVTHALQLQGTAVTEGASDAALLAGLQHAAG